MASLKNTIINDTGYLQLPSGTTAQRPSSPATGYMRWNTTEGYTEVYDGSAWVELGGAPPPPEQIEYIVVAGGGSGNKGFINNFGSTGGGGGAGGLAQGVSSLIGVGTIQVVIGAGATWVQIEDTSASGNPTSVSSNTINLTVQGGGGAGMQSRSGGDGGSGGGAQGGAGGQHNVPGSGIIGQGNNGGNGNPSNYQPAGGGGGYSSAGGIGTAGSGLQTSITGDLEEYAKGGTGGSGSINGSAGAAGTGNGGNGGGGSNTNVGGNGGGGVVILRVPTANYTGSYSGSPSIIVDSQHTILKFTSSGTYNT